jgi:Putative peptidoglycan binding domain
MPDNEQRSFTSVWLAAPLLSAVVGLIGTGVGAVLQGFWNTRLERQKFEFSLIEKALATADKKEAAQNLRFLVDAGLINGLNADKIASVASNPEALPDFTTFLRNVGRNLAEAQVIEAKRYLSRLGIYRGPIDDEDNKAFRKAVVDFQASRNMTPNGELGPETMHRLYVESLGAGEPKVTFPNK